MFTLNPQYAYFALCIGFVLVWILIYTFSSMTRHEQFRMSLISAPFGPITELLYFRDYWYPQSAFPIRLGPVHTIVEDTIFAFACAGVATVVYPMVFRLSLVSDSTLSSGGRRWVFLIVSLLSLGLVWLGMNSIFATSIGFLVGTAWIIWHRPDLGWPALWSGILLAMVMLIGYRIGFSLIANSEELLLGVWRLSESPWGTRRIIGIPATELIWGFSFGTLFGPLYAFGLRKRYV